MLYRNYQLEDSISKKKTFKRIALENKQGFKRKNNIQSSDEKCGQWTT